MSTIITATAKDWLAALTFIAPAFGRRAAAPFLTCVRIAPLTGHLRGFNFEVGAETHLGEFQGEGRAPFLASYRELVDAIKLTTKGDRSALVTVSPGRDGDRFFATVDAAGYSIGISAHDPAEYPTADREKATSRIKVMGRDLKAAITRVGVAASKDDTLPILTGIQFVHEGSALTLLATDRYRLATDVVPTLGAGTKDPAAFLLKASLAAEAARRSVAAQEVAIEVIGNERVRFRLPGGILDSLLVDGDYPKIKSLFPYNPAGAFAIERAPLLAAARVAGSMVERNTPVVLHFTLEGVKLAFNMGLFGGSTSPLIKGGCVGPRPEEFQTAFNPAYLVPALAALDGELVRFSYTSAPNPVMLTEHEEGTAHKHLLMPVRLPSRVEL